MDSEPAALLLADPKATLDEAEQTVARSDVPYSASYLKAVDDVQSLIKALSMESCDRRDAATLDQAQNVLQLGMSRLEDEFRGLLERYSESVDPEWLFDPVANPSFGSMSEDTASLSGVEDSFEGDEEVATSRPISNRKLHIDMLPREIVPDLSEIAVRMVGCDYKNECCQVYVHIRKGILDESVYRMGLEKLSIEDVQRMSWEALETEIVSWIKALKVSVGVLFPSEKQLCEEVFAGLPSVSEWCFAEIGRGAMMQLLNFGEAVAIGRRTPEKLSRILDMYEELRDLLADIDALFSGSSCAMLRAEAVDVLNHLGEAARGTFAEFANAIKRDITRNPVPGGAVHPLTRYVMNYLRLLSCFVSTLSQILGDRRSTEVLPPSGADNSSSPSHDHVGGQQDESSLSILSLMNLLEDNLHKKAQLYKDTALSHLFLMNNYQYIVQKVKASEVRTLLTDDWLRRHMSSVRQYHNQYLRAAWTRVLSCLRDEGVHVSGSSFSSGVSKSVLKERFKAFNAAFEEVVKTQQSWIVSDPQLCADLRISIVEMLLPAYRSFLGRFRNYLDNERHPERYSKYSAEDLESTLNDLFEEGTGSVHRRRSFSTT